MSNINYHTVKSNKKRKIESFDLEKIDGYELKPKVKKEEAIEVNKIVILSSEMSEQIIRKKIDKKILSLLNKLKEIDTDDSDAGNIIEKNLIACEKLRLQIINKYVKYLGNTYRSLTLKKIEVIVNELKFKLYETVNKQEKLYYEEESNEKKSHRGR